MSNGAECCILGICCPPAEARASLVTKLASMPSHEAAADYLLAEFDFAPKGSLAPFKEAIVALVKHHHGV